MQINIGHLDEVRAKQLQMYFIAQLVGGTQMDAACRSTSATRMRYGAEPMNRGACCSECTAASSCCAVSAAAVHGMAICSSLVAFCRPLTLICHLLQSGVYTNSFSMHSFVDFWCVTECGFLPHSAAERRVHQLVLHLRALRPGPRQGERINVFFANSFGYLDYLVAPFMELRRAALLLRLLPRPPLSSCPVLRSAPASPWQEGPSSIAAQLDARQHATFTWPSAR